MTTQPIHPVDRPCCDATGTNDAEVQRLRDLMRDGMGQLAASRLVFGGAA